MEENEGAPTESQHQGLRHVAEVMLDIPVPAGHPDEGPGQCSHMNDPQLLHMEQKNHPFKTNQHKELRGMISCYF